MILLIDNYDSFSYNLFQQAAAIEPEIKVVRNDALTIGEIEGLNPSHIILSPGPRLSERCGNLRGSGKQARRQHPHPRRVPRPSGHLRSVRR